MQKKLGEQIGQNRYSEKHQPNFEQRLEIHIRGRLREFIRNYTGQRVAGLKERRCNLWCVSDHHCHRHRFAERSSQTKNDGAEQAVLCVAEHRDSRCFPPRCAERVGGFTLQIWHTAQNLTGDGSDDRQNHNRDDDAASQHARAVDWPCEKRRPTEKAFQ